MQVPIVLTLIGPDRPGLVELVAQTVSSFDGNWLESRMSRLAGQFAGILLIEVDESRSDQLVRALGELESHGLRIDVERDAGAGGLGALRALSLALVGTDRPGIVREISQALARREVNVDELRTHRTVAPMSGESLFRATVKLRAPDGVSIAELRLDLEKISLDMMVDIELIEDEQG